MLLITSFYNTFYIQNFGFLCLGFWYDKTVN